MINRFAIKTVAANMVRWIAYENPVEHRAEAEEQLTWDSETEIPVFLCRGGIVSPFLYFWLLGALSVYSLVHLYACG